AAEGVVAGAPRPRFRRRPHRAHPRGDPMRRRCRDRGPARVARGAREPRGGDDGGRPPAARSRGVPRAPQADSFADARLHRGQSLSARRLPVSLPGAAEVRDFWFGTGEAFGKSRREWYRKDEAFDQEIGRRFGSLLGAAARRELESWRSTPGAMVALVVVLDQFPRNLFRGDPRAFAQDAYAR